MQSWSDLNTKLENFLANCEIKDLKISKKERSVPELRSHHRQEKERFRLDRINLVRRHCVDPVPDNDCVDCREDDRCFKIASTIFPKVAHRALLTSFELVEEAKKGNLTPVAAIRFDGYGTAFTFGEKQMTEVAHSDSISTASANATIFSGRLTLCTVRSSTKSFMPCKKRRNIDRAIMHQAQKSLLQMVDDDDEEHMSTADRKKVSFQIVSPARGSQAVENEQDQSSNIFA